MKKFKSRRGRTSSFRKRGSSGRRSSTILVPRGGTRL